MSQYQIEREDMSDFYNDPRLLCLAKIKLKSKFVKDEEEYSAVKELEEIVRFLLS